MKRFYQGLSRKGSALLIVLGFLSFMMVSAVSFAIYMRIERQASSNYRHTITARHLLNAALYRAIDEIDSELRIQSLNGTDQQPVKFPEWPGRTKPSAVPNGLDNGQEARVLSFESLSFIPAVFVNDVRRYAVSNQLDTVRGLTAPDRCSYLGTKWRTLSLPVSSFGDVNGNRGAPNAYEEAIIGRYAYLCVNVSDLLDVNRSKACVRTGTNHVSLAHLFYDMDNPNNTWGKSAREDFDNYVRQTAIRFETLQDFYACMHARNDATFGSPYHEYLSALQNEDGDDVFDTADNHILVTDSLAKPQLPGENASPKACNIHLQQPISQTSLNAAQTAGVSLEDQSVQGRDGFKTSLEKMFAGRLPDGANLNDCFPVMLADYLDEDNIPKTLNMPTVEIVPMISQLLVPQFFRPELKMRSDGGTPPLNTYYIDLNPNARAQLSVEVAWPYKHLEDRTCPKSDAYSVEITAYMTVHKQHQEKDSTTVAGSINECPVTLTGTQAVPDFSGKDDEDQNACFQTVDIPLTASGNTQIDILTSDGSTATLLDTDFALNTPFSVSLIVFARVKRGSVYVDSAPKVLPLMQSPDREFITCNNKLFFQTNESAPLGPVMALNPLDWEWRSLEAPDPRFNHKTANWLLVNEPAASIPPRMSDVTSSQLLGKDGRDGDIFMTVSDAGRMVSPGELGFILRPFSFDPVGNTVKFLSRTALDPNSSAAGDDSKAYFRTIRLYDHDPANPSDPETKAQDPVYDYFVVQNADGSSLGPCVTPLSESPVVLASAMEQTPVDFWFASLDPNSDRDAMMDNTFNTQLGTTDWPRFRRVWMDRLTNCVKKTTSTGQNIRNTWKHSLSEYYGDYDKFGWYSAGQPDQIFSSGTPASLSKLLHEIDRKMLYAFSLDSFSDRQQLFLYILRAEVTVPSFGSSQDSGTKSLAGGRAVALVWRDPYPVEYNPATDSWLRKNWATTPRRISPWYQVNQNRYDESKEVYVDDLRRYDSYHDFRILYFKQLND